MCACMCELGHRAFTPEHAILKYLTPEVINEDMCCTYSKDNPCVEKAMRIRIILEVCKKMLHIVIQQHHVHGAVLKE